MALMKAFLRFRPISSSLCRHTSTVSCADSAASEINNLSSLASAEAEKAVRNGPRNDWTKPEIQAVYDSPIMDLLFHGADLVGGYYDAGDNVKHGLPMAFTVTILAWGAPQYRDELSAAGELENVRDPDAIKWGTDYFIKASATENQRWEIQLQTTTVGRIQRGWTL